jgi:ubiquinone/menaquinone biosynthesis C-methylase UbiE
MTSSIIEANIVVHSRMAGTYEQDEPHFRAENQAKVRTVLEGLSRQVGGGRMLDLGCGTGFLIRLAKDLFSEIHGIDVTQAMLDRVDTSAGHITVHNASAEKIPFPDGSFDIVTAYAFLHHTEDYWQILREASRVLRPGGVCYVDLEPNKRFWEAMSRLPDGNVPSLSAMVQKARDSVIHVDEQVERDFGIPQETFRQAEYSKAVLGGLDVAEISRRAQELGFSDCRTRLEWFLGQAEVMHGQSFETAALIESHLRSLAPLTDHLFKYVQLILVR